MSRRGSKGSSASGSTTEMGLTKKKSAWGTLKKVKPSGASRGTTSRATGASGTSVSRQVLQVLSRGSKAVAVTQGPKTLNFKTLDINDYSWQLINKTKGSSKTMIKSIIWGLMHNEGEYIEERLPHMTLFAETGDIHMSWSNDSGSEYRRGCVHGSWSNRTLCTFKDKTRFGQDRNKANICAMLWNKWWTEVWREEIKKLNTPDKLIKFCNTCDAPHYDRDESIGPAEAPELIPVRGALRVSAQNAVNFTNSLMNFQH